MTFDRDKAREIYNRAAGQVAAGFNCMLSALCDQLGLYRTIADTGPIDSVALAEKTGLSERWLREWLRHQACARHLDYADGCFSLSPEAEAVFADEDHPLFFASGFRSVTAAFPAFAKMPEVFKTGIGLAYDDHGEACACNIEQMSSYVQKKELVRKILPQLDGMLDHLSRGATVADVGCGAGLATLAMGAAFPASTFVGYDTSEHALARATDNLNSSGLANVRFVNPFDEALPDAPTYDLVTTFDVVHDTPYPDQLIASIRASLVEDGIWLCSDLRSYPTFEQNLAEHPGAASLYGASVMICMSSSLSMPDGAGLGTLGFNEVVAREMSAAAGFTRFRTMEYKNPMNSYYEIRP